jgi:hypothetical protein
MKDLTIVCLLFSLGMMGYFLTLSAGFTQEAERLLKIETEALKVQTAKVIEYEKMINRDDRILDTFMNGSWKRECQYELIAGVLLADGSVRSSLIQHCEEK